MLGGLLRNEAYHSVYDPQATRNQLSFTRQIRLQDGGSASFKDISIGESRVWALDDPHQALYFNPGSKRWSKINSKTPTGQKLAWKSIESASPNVVYAIELFQGNLYFRDGINPENPKGEKWINTGLKVTQVSSNPYVTYIITKGSGEFKSFTTPPSSQNLKTWITSLVSHNKKITNKLSVGFGNTMVFLDESNKLVVRERLPMKNEQYGSIWSWRPEDVVLSDVAAGPVLFGIFDNKLVASKKGRYF